MPSSKRAKRGPAAPELRRTTRAAARGAADGGTGDVAAAKGKHAADQQAGRVESRQPNGSWQGQTQRRTSSARPAPSKGTRRRVAFAEHAAEADEGAGCSRSVSCYPRRRPFAHCQTGCHRGRGAACERGRTGGVQFHRSSHRARLSGMRYIFIAADSATDTCRACGIRRLGQPVNELCQLPS